MPAAAKADNAEAVPTIDKNILLYHPTRNNAELDEQKSQAKANRSLDVQIPFSLKPDSRNENVAEKVENGGGRNGASAYECLCIRRSSDSFEQAELLAGLKGLFKKKSSHGEDFLYKVNVLV